MLKAASHATAIHSDRSRLSDESGQCRCQPGVMGQKCDRCAPGHFSFQEGGCTRKNSPPNLEPLIGDRVFASVIQSGCIRAFRCRKYSNYSRINTLKALSLAHLISNHILLLSTLKKLV